MTPPIDSRRQPITFGFAALSIAIASPFVFGGLHAVNTLGDIKTEIALLRKDIVAQGEKVSGNAVSLNARVTVREMEMWVAAFRASNSEVQIPPFGK